MAISPIRYHHCSLVHYDPTAVAIFRTAERKISNLIVTLGVPNGNTVLQLAELLGPMITVLKVQLSIVYDPSNKVKAGLLQLAQRHDFVVLADRSLGKNVKSTTRDVTSLAGSTRVSSPTYVLSSVASCSMHSTSELINALSKTTGKISICTAEDDLLPQLKHKGQASTLPKQHSVLAGALGEFERSILKGATYGWGFLHVRAIPPLRLEVLNNLEHLLVIPPDIAGDGPPAWASPQPHGNTTTPLARFRKGSRFHGFENGSLSKETLYALLNAIRVNSWHASRGEGDPQFSVPVKSHSMTTVSNTEPASSKRSDVGHPAQANESSDRSSTMAGGLHQPIQVDGAVGAPESRSYNSRNGRQSMTIACDAVSTTPAVPDAGPVQGSEHALVKPMKTPALVGNTQASLHKENMPTMNGGQEQKKSSQKPISMPKQRSTTHAPDVTSNELHCRNVSSANRVRSQTIDLTKNQTRVKYVDNCGPQ